MTQTIGEMTDEMTEKNAALSWSFSLQVNQTRPGANFWYKSSKSEENIAILDKQKTWTTYLQSSTKREHSESAPRYVPSLPISHDMLQ